MSVRRNLRKEEKKGNTCRRVVKSIFTYIQQFVLFFAMVSFVVTCSFPLFFSAIGKNIVENIGEAEIRTFAPVVFFNVIVLAVLFMVSDLIRRKISIDRPTKELQRVLQNLIEGDFDARISKAYMGHKEYRFNDIADSINSLAQELGSLETLRTDFIANVSHELKTPLAVMQNYGTMLQQPGLSEEKRLEYSKAITETSRRLASLITNILKLNKLENQQIFPTMQEYDLGEQLCECLLQFEDEWERRNIEIETDIQENVTVCSDAELLSLVWNNLISNAMKFTEPGGSVSVSLAAEADRVVVKVADTGCGMKPEVGTHIFEKFFQGDTSHATQGNGLGLALVKRVVDIMNGEISVESVYGKGSTFTVKFERSKRDGSSEQL